VFHVSRETFLLHELTRQGFETLPNGYGSASLDIFEIPRLFFSPTFEKENCVAIKTKGRCKIGCHIAGMQHLSTNNGVEKNRRKKYFSYTSLRKQINIEKPIKRYEISCGCIQGAF